MSDIVASELVLIQFEQGMSTILKALTTIANTQCQGDSNPHFVRSGAGAMPATPQEAANRTLSQ
jgi:hypothetical protein